MKQPWGLLIQGKQYIKFCLSIPRFHSLTSPGPGRTDFQLAILQSARLDVLVSILDPAKLGQKKLQSSTSMAAKSPQVQNSSTSSNGGCFIVMLLS